MAVFTRINGDAAGIVNSDAGRSFANAAIINTGIAAPLTAYRIYFAASTSGAYGNLAAELTTGGAVETILRIIEGNATVLAYQVDATTSGSQLSVLTERNGWTDSLLTTQLQTGANQFGATGGNIGATSNIWVSTNGTSPAVSSAYGIKIASSSSV